MIVNVKIMDSTIKISCGDGRQSFKWLASVIQSRLKQSKVLRNNFESENYLVTEIRNVNGELLNPVDLIFEHAGPNGLDIVASTSNIFPIDEWENPEMGDWLKGAHISSDIGKRWFSESEAWRESLSALQENNKNQPGSGGSRNNQNILNQHNQQQSTSSLVKIGFDFSDSDISSAFDLDWSTMKWSFLPSNVTDHQRNAVGDCLKSHYAVVCNIFAHYCGIGQVGQRYGLTLNDFAHLMHFLKIYNVKREMKDIEDAYYKSGPLSVPTASTTSLHSNTQQGGGGNKWPLMTRAHLSQALLYVAMKEGEAGDPASCLLSLIGADSPLAKLWADVMGRYLYHTCEDVEQSDALRKTTMEYYQLLKQAFESRAVLDPKAGPKLSVSSFVDMLVESTMIETEQESVCVKAFLQSHFNPTVEWELGDMVLCEFIEALSRVSVKIIENTSGLSDAKKIRMAFNFMTELPHSSQQTQQSAQK